jgi:hypothetical protein
MTHLQGHASRCIEAYIGLIGQPQPAVQTMIVCTMSASNLNGSYVLGGFGFHQSAPVPRTPALTRTMAEVISEARLIRAGLPEVETEPGGVVDLLADMHALALERRQATATLLDDEDVE